MIERHIYASLEKKIDSPAAFATDVSRAIAIIVQEELPEKSLARGLGLPSKAFLGGVVCAFKNGASMVALHAYNDGRHTTQIGLFTVDSYLPFMEKSRFTQRVRDSLKGFGYTLTERRITSDYDNSSSNTEPVHA